jgi:hypothetical protein
MLNETNTETENTSRGFVIPVQWSQKCPKEDFFSSFGGVKGDFSLLRSNGVGTFCLYFWNLHKIWV